MELREYFATHGEEENVVAARHAALRNWNERLKFCSACGVALPPVNEDTTECIRECPICSGGERG